MPTFAQEIVNNQIIISATVANPGQNSSQTYFAIVDTGAQTTLISEKAIKDTGLPQAGHTLIRGVTGSERVAKYKARVDIPVVVNNAGVMAAGMELEIVTMPHPLGEFDVLLGMDFLSGFHITMFNNNFVLSI